MITNTQLLKYLDAMDASGLNPSEIRILVLLSEPGCPDRPTTIGGKLGFGIQVAGLNINSLSRKGYVCKSKPGEGDGRHVFVSITDEGRKALENIHQLAAVA